MPSAPIQRRGLLGLPAFARSAEPGPVSFELVPQPKAGDELHVRAPRRAQGDVLYWYRKPVRLRVAAVNDTGTLPHWTGGAVALLEIEAQRRPMVEAGLAIMNGITLEVRLDAHGRHHAPRIAGRRTRRARRLRRRHAGRVAGLGSPCPTHHGRCHGADGYRFVQPPRRLGHRRAG